MKIAITSTGQGLEADVDPRLGRAHFFLIYDTDSKRAETLDNAQNLNAAQGAGVQAAQNLAKAEVQAVLTGNCGPKAFQVLNAAGITVYVGLSGSVSEAIAEFESGRLEPCDAANKPGHWG